MIEVIFHSVVLNQMVEILLFLFIFAGKINQ